MRRPSLLFTVVIGFALVLGACAGSSSSPSSAAESEGGEPSTAAEQSEAPAASQAAESQPAASEGGTGGEAPALTDGPWTGGHAVITVSGGVSLTIDEDLTPDRSETFDATTQLVYNTDAEFVTTRINSTGTPFYASITAEDFSVLSSTCEVTYARADDTGIDATFSCVGDEFYWYSVDPEPTDPVVIEGTITATR